MRGVIRWVQPLSDIFPDGGEWSDLLECTPQCTRCTLPCHPFSYLHHWKVSHLLCKFEQFWKRSLLCGNRPRHGNCSLMCIHRGGRDGGPAHCPPQVHFEGLCVRAWEGGRPRQRHTATSQSPQADRSHSLTLLNNETKI